MLFIGRYYVHTPFEGLAVIGYADSLTAKGRPCIVAPVFMNAIREMVLVPPFRLEPQSICGGTWIDEEELKKLETEAQVTLFTEGTHLTAKEGCTLWVTRSGKIRYEQNWCVKERLSVVAHRAIRHATIALTKGNLVLAEELGRLALLANGQRIEPYAILDAACSTDQKEEEYRLTLELVASTIGEEAFGVLRDYYASKIPKKQ